MTNSNINLQLSDQSMWYNDDMVYFVSAWPISNYVQLSNMELKIQSDSTFRNKMVIYNIIHVIINIVLQ